MSLPGDTISRIFKRESTAGAGVAGKTIGNFTVQAWLDGVATSVSPAVTSLGSGYYRFSYTLPSTPGYFDLQIDTDDTDIIVWPSLSGDIESVDYATLAARILSPVASLNTGLQVGTEQTLTTVWQRYREVNVTITDDEGNAVDLSGYNNFQMQVNTEDQATVYDVTSVASISGDAQGVLSFTIPEDAAFFAELDKGAASVVLWYEITGDQAATASQTVSLLRGTLTIVRGEVGHTA